MVFLAFVLHSFCTMQPSSKAIGRLHNSDILSSAASTNDVDSVATSNDVVAALPKPSPPPKKKYGGQKKKKRSKSRQRAADDAPSGRIANVHWRRLSMGALRCHPKFSELPPARSSAALEATLENAATFRQDTWRWDAMHAGRLTGRHAAAALGFFGVDTAPRLRIPPGMRDPSRPVQAVKHLSRGEEVDVASLFVQTDFDDEDEDAADWEQTNGGFWRPSATRVVPRGIRDARSARLVWGKAQEACGIAAAIDYVNLHYDQPCFVAEAGMLAAERPSLDALFKGWGYERSGEASPSRRQDEPLLLGASPDGFVVRENDGSVDILEIKSVSPFLNRKSDGMLSFRDRGPNPTVAPWILPQLCLSIYCAGPSCRGALLASVSATRGSCFFYVPRNDEYIDQMIAFLDHFHRECVLGTTHPSDLDYNIVGDYEAFIDKTLDIAQQTNPTRMPVAIRPQDNSTYFLDDDDDDHSVAAPKTQMSSTMPSPLSSARRRRRRHRGKTN